MATDLSLLDTKQFQKYAKYAGEKNAKDLLSLGKEELEKIIVDSELYEQQVKQEKDSNPQFQSAKEILKDFNSSARETINPVKAKKALASAALKSLKEHK